jgi:opacity protein-like surface antigen
MPNKYVVVVLVLVLTLLSASVVSAQNEWTGNVNAFLGRKTLDKSDWEPVEKQGEFGLEVDFRQKDWPISIAIDILGASGKGDVVDPSFGTIDTFKSRTSEFNIGVRKIWEVPAPVRPFIGGGLSLMRAEAEVSIPGVGSNTESDTGAGIWIGGGVYFTLGDHFNLGLELKYSTADVTIAGVDTNAGGTHFGLLAGIPLVKIRGQRFYSEESLVNL